MLAVYISANQGYLSSLCFLRFSISRWTCLCSGFVFLTKTIWVRLRNHHGLAFTCFTHFGRHKLSWKKGGNTMFPKYPVPCSQSGCNVNVIWQALGPCHVKMSPSLWHVQIRMIQWFAEAWTSNIWAATGLDLIDIFTLSFLHSVVKEREKEILRHTTSTPWM